MGPGNKNWDDIALPVGWASESRNYTLTKELVEEVGEKTQATRVRWCDIESLEDAGTDGGLGTAGHDLGWCS